VDKNHLRKVLWSAALGAVLGFAFRLLFAGFDFSPEGCGETAIFVLVGTFIAAMVAHG
jgi:hypothetical protein